MSNGMFQTLEEKLGIVTGILQNIPGQIDHLFNSLNKEIREQSALHAVIDTKLDQLDRDVNKTCARDRSNCPYYERFKASHELERDVRDLVELEKKVRDQNLFQVVDDLTKFQKKIEDAEFSQTLKELVDFKKGIEDNRSFFKRHAATFITSILSFTVGSVAVYFILKLLGKGG